LKSSELATRTMSCKNPEHYTPNPKLLTPNPKPGTLNPEP